MIYTRKYRTPERVSNPDSHYFEVDAQKIVTVIEDIIEKSAAITTKLDGILFSTQQHGCVLHHAELKRDYYISWQDTRCLKISPQSGKSYIEEIEDILGLDGIRRTGVPVKPALAMCNLYTLFKETGIARRPDTRLYTLGSYVIEKLTGNNICHITNAAPLGFADILDGKWDMEILRKTGLDFLQLPRIESGLNCCGYYKTKNICLPVFPDLGDVQTSVYGTGAKSGDMIINIGTSGQLIRICDEYIPGEYEIRPYYDNNYCYVISRMPGGRNFDVQIDFLKEVGEKLFGVHLEREEIWARIQKRCQGLETGGLEVDCSFYELPDRLADGKIIHIDRANFTPEHVIAATAIDYGRQYRRFADVLSQAQPFCGELFFSGGALLKNPFLQEAIKQEMNVATVKTAQQDEVYSGLFMLAKRCVRGHEV